MFALAASRRNRFVSGLGALLFASGIAVAEEKANITPPAVPQKPVDSAPPKEEPASFRALDRNSSLGAVIDPGLPLTPTPSAPGSTLTPRQQRELFERFDRQRNFLLVDPSDNLSDTDRWLEGGESRPDNRFNSGRPATLLERQLNGTGRAAAEELSEDAKAPKPSRSETFFNNDAAKAGRESSLTRPMTTDRPAAESSLPNFSAPELGEVGSAGPATLDELRSILATEGGRGLGLDPFTKQRQERYLQTFGEIKVEGRTFESISEGFGQARGLRSDPTEPTVSPSPVAPTPGASLDALVAPPTDAGDLTRSATRDPGALGVIPNVYAPLPTAPQPAPIPALKFLKEPRPEPPRGRL